MFKIIFLFLKNYLTSFRKTYLRFESVFMITGLMLSVMILTASLLLFNGYTKTLKDALLGVNAHIYIFNRTRRLLSDYDVEILHSLLSEKNEITSFSPVKTTQALARVKEISRGVFVRDIQWQRDVLPIRYKEFIIEGNYKLIEDKEVVIGEKLAELLNIGLEDEFTIISPTNTKFTVFGIKSTELTAKVTGIFKSGMYDFDSRYIFANSNFLNNFLTHPDKYEMIEVSLKPDFISKADYLSHLWSRELKHDYIFRSWLDFNENLFVMLNLQKWVIYIILSFLIAISSINVISFIVTAITEKKKEIGILKSYGMKNLYIKAIFLAQGFLISIISIISGLFAGMLLAYILTKQSALTLKGDIYFLETFEISIEPTTIILIFITATLIVFLSSLIPLGIISKYSVIDIVRNK